MALLLVLFSLLLGFLALGPFGGTSSPPTATVMTAAPVVMTSASGVQPATFPAGADKAVPEAETVVHPDETVTIRSSGRFVVTPRRCGARTPSAPLRGRDLIRWRVPLPEARYVLRVSSPSAEALLGLVVAREARPRVARWSGSAC